MVYLNEDYKKAIELRKKGLSYSEILKCVPVAKSTLSLWLRSVGLSKKQRQRLTDKLDTVFSRFKRLMSGGYCKRCWLTNKPKSNAYKGYDRLQNAHCHSRVKRSVRWDEDNVAPLCGGCHMYLDREYSAKQEFFLGLLGQAGFNALNERANQKKQFTIEELRRKIEYFKARIKELQEE